MHGDGGARRGRRFSSLERWRVAYLGRSSPLVVALGGLADVPKERRREVGKRGNTSAV